MNPPTQNQTNYLEAFQMFGKMIELSKCLVSASRCEGLTLLRCYLELLNDKMLKPNNENSNINSMRQP